MWLSQKEMAKNGLKMAKNYHFRGGNMGILDLSVKWLWMKLFEVCKSLKYSSGNWLFDYDPKKSHQDTPVLHNSNWRGIRTDTVLTGFEGFRATSGRRVLNNKCSTRSTGSLGTTSNHPSRHSCPPRLQLRRHKDGYSLDGFWGV